MLDSNHFQAARPPPKIKRLHTSTKTIPTTVLTTDKFVGDTWTHPAHDVHGVSFPNHENCLCGACFRLPEGVLSLILLAVGGPPEVHLAGQWSTVLRSIVACLAPGALCQARTPTSSSRRKVSVARLLRPPNPTSRQCCASEFRICSVSARGLVRAGHLGKGADDRGLGA